MSDRRGNVETFVSVSIGEPTETRGLTKHSPWDKTPWKPGEIPASPLMRIGRPHTDYQVRSQWEKQQDIECGPIKERGMGPRKFARRDGGDSTGYDK